MRFVCQKDYPDMEYITRVDLEGEEKEKGSHTTVCSSGCGLCSSVMVADRLLTDYKFDIEDAVALSYAAGANRGIGTNFSIYSEAFAEKFDLKYVPTDDIEEVCECLRTGGAVVALVRQYGDYISVFTHKSHYVTLVSLEEDGRFCVLDPSYFEGKYDEPGREGRVEVKGRLVFCDKQTMMAETDFRRGYRYYMFWRKA